MLVTAAVAVRHRYRIAWHDQGSKRQAQRLSPRVHAATQASDAKIVQAIRGPAEKGIMALIRADLREKLDEAHTAHQA